MRRNFEFKLRKTVILASILSPNVTSFIHYLYRLFLLSILITLGSCTQEDIENAPQTTRELISLSQDNLLQSIQEDLLSDSESGRQIPNEFLDRTQWDKIYRIAHPEIARTTYTIPLALNTSQYFENLIIIDVDGNSSSFVLRYSPEKNWIESGYLEEGMPAFRGELSLLSLQGEAIATSDYENGQYVSLDANVAGRISSGCETVFKVEYWYACIGETCTYTEITITEYEVCPDSGGGDFPIVEEETGDETGGETTIGILEPECLKGVLDENGVCISAADAWEEDICEKPSFQSNECLQHIWNTMKKNNIGYETLTSFLGDTPIAILCLDVKDIGDDANGNTDPSVSGQVTISLNSKKLNRSKLSVARTLLHEMIHAELISLVIEAGGYSNFQNYAKNYDDEFLAIWDYIEEFEPEGWQHEYMADNYITYIADGLKLLEPFYVSSTFKSAVNGGYYDDVIGEPWNWDDFYQYMAWEGLHKTEQFQTDIVNKNFKNKYDQYRLRFEDGNSVTLDCQ